MQASANVAEPKKQPLRPLYAPQEDYDHDLAQEKRMQLRKWLGLNHLMPIKDHTEGMEYLLWPRIRIIIQEALSEFLGTLVLTLIYQGSLAQATLGTGIQTAPGGSGYGSYMSAPWGVGIGVMLGIYVAGDSGSYLNPAITVSNAIFRGLPLRSVPILILSQFLGSFIGSGLVFGNYVSAIDWYSGHGVRAVTPTPQATASIFATYPASFAPKGSQAFSIIIPSMIVAIVVSALKDDYNNGVSKAGGNFFPLAMFFLFFSIAVAFGWETGGAVNPALDFGGRLMSNALGYPSEVWSTGGYYFWMPMVLPFIGTTIGGFLYDLFVYTGPSPVNTPFLGLRSLVRPDIERHNKQIREEAHKNPETDAI